MQVLLDDLMYWVIPGMLAGMQQPFVHPGRRRNHGGDLMCRNDHLPILHAAGVRAFVSLLDDFTDAPVYLSAGFEFLHLPVAVRKAPTFHQAHEAIAFIHRQRSKQRAVAVYCDAGLGRTGTLLAAYLISEGEAAEGAIARVRKAQKVAVETPRQTRFLYEFAAMRGYCTLRAPRREARAWSLSG